MSEKSTIREPYVLVNLRCVEAHSHRLEQRFPTSVASNKADTRE